MNHFNITSTLRALLLQNTEIKNLVGDKIYPLLAPNNTEGDFILYQRDGYATDDTKMGISKFSPLVYFNIISEDYDRSQQIAGLVNDHLVGKYDKMEVSLEDSTEDVSDKKYIQILMFKIQL